MKKFFILINKDDKYQKEIDNNHVENIINDLLLEKEQDNNEFEIKKEKNEEIVEIYENCLKGFKYEINKKENNSQSRFKILAQYNEKKLKTEG